jgi:protein-tyrosine phosphatase
MIDIHCHILPQIDDGADSFDTACAMAEMAIEDGITHIIATPHASPGYRFIPDLIRERCDQMQTRFEGRLVFATGCDFHLSFENIRDLRNDPHRFTLNQKNYLLVEFADFSIPASMDNTLHDLRLMGLTPVITHPERNPLIRSKPERMYRWVRQGCYTQVTAQSLLGKFGNSAQQATIEWLGAGAIHFVASDAHNATSRPLRLREAHTQIAKLHGEEVADALLDKNPRAAMEGEALPFVPEMDEAVGQAPGARIQRPKKRFWFF